MFLFLSIFCHNWQISFYPCSCSLLSHFLPLISHFSAFDKSYTTSNLHFSDLIGKIFCQVPLVPWVWRFFRDCQCDGSFLRKDFCYYHLQNRLMQELVVTFLPHKHYFASRLPKFKMTAKSHPKSPLVWEFLVTKLCVRSWLLIIFCLGSLRQLLTKKEMPAKPRNQK